MASIIFSFDNTQNFWYYKSNSINFNIFWLLFLGLGESNYELFLLKINNFAGKFILIGFTWSMFFHLLSGVRHLVWDLGYGFEVKTANISGVIVIVSSLALTVIFWLFVRGFV